jgi:hypothetical protein
MSHQINAHGAGVTSARLPRAQHDVRRHGSRCTEIHGAAQSNAQPTLARPRTASPAAAGHADHVGPQRRRSCTSHLTLHSRRGEKLHELGSLATAVPRPDAPGSDVGRRPGPQIPGPRRPLAGGRRHFTCEACSGARRAGSFRRQAARARSALDPAPSGPARCNGSCSPAAQRGAQSELPCPCSRSMAVGGGTDEAVVL